jgi:hypothetical protein
VSDFSHAGFPYCNIYFFRRTFSLQNVIDSVITPCSHLLINSVVLSSAFLSVFSVQIVGAGCAWLTRAASDWLYKRLAVSGTS